MDPFITTVVAIVLIFSGVWGTMLLRWILQRGSRTLEAPADDPRIAELVEDHQLLEHRLQRIEEELTFLRELHQPEPPGQLSSGANESP